MTPPPPLYGSAEEACVAYYLELDGGVNTYDGLMPGSGWSRRCGWHSDNPGIEPKWYRNGQVWLECDAGYAMWANGCRRDGSDHRGDRCAPTTPHPINILTGQKTLRREDFETADGAISLERIFVGNAFGGAGMHYVADPAALANWVFGFQYEVQIPGNFGTDGVISVLTPNGELAKFKKQTDGSLLPYTTTSRPTAHTDYKLEMLDTWTGTPASAKTHWRLTDGQDNVWLLETYQTLQTADYAVGRPTQVTTHKGRVITFANTTNGKLTSMTDDLGKTVSFTWITENGSPKEISQVDLPGGYKLKYTYEATNTATFAIDRLKKAEFTDASNTVLDRVSYDYGNTDYPSYVTGIRDKDGTLRWSVTYDSDGRATSSSGPSGADGYTVAYSTPGATFTRTVTNPLGKVAVYNFAQSALTTYDTRLVSVNGQASTNCPSSSTSTTYNPNTFVASATDEEGRLTQYGRDARGRPIVVVEGAGSAVERSTSLSWNTGLNLPNRVQEPGLRVDYSFQGGSSPPSGTLGSYVFPFVGAPQSQVVPAGYTSATVEMWGGAGGNGNYNAGAWSGAGGYVKATFAVSPSDVLRLEVGGGGQPARRNTPGGAGGWPDGGPGGYGDDGSGGGGGSTRFYINGVLKAVAGGGGGSGGWNAWGSAGAGGGTSGQNAGSPGGTGGTQSAVGVDSSATSSANKKGRSLVSFPGTQRTGGFGSDNGDPSVLSSDDGGGGGGGYYGGGGGGGDGQSGGGGSSWTHSSATSVTNTAGNVQTPAGSPPTGVALGKNSEVNGNGVAGGDGYAKVDLQ